MQTAIGTMSGTSLDGVDVAMIETDGERVGRFGPSLTRPYAEAERAVLRTALVEAVALTDRTARPGIFSEAERIVTAAHADAIATFMTTHGIARDSVDVVGFHGQTVLHRPEARLTVQIGDGPALAAKLGLRIVHDFRAADVAAGGQGAPLVPVYHRALARGLSGDGPVIVANIGGVSNVTFIEGETLIACDTGPGNALLDDFMLTRTGRALDLDGAAAASGKANAAWLAQALQHPFFAKPAPKSLDRNAFAALALPDLSTADGAATLTAFTAHALAGSVGHLPKPPARWIVAGGGARNPTLMAMLCRAVAPAGVQSADDLGWSVDAMEAQAFGFLAVRSLHGLPLSFPMTTGVSAPMCGGVVTSIAFVTKDASS